MYISLKECAETAYWLELLYSADFLTESEYNSVKTDCEELMKLLTSITKSTRNNINN